MSKLIAIGEALIDMIPNEKGRRLKDVTSFERCCGGAPGNLASAFAKSGGKAILLTKVGNDAFGDFIIETLSKEGVDTSYILKTDLAHTGLAFVSLSASGERDFSFYRNPSADLFYEEDDLPLNIFEKGDILHFGSVDLIPSDMAKAHDRAILEAKKRGLIISFDPNLRFSLWPDLKLYCKTIREHLSSADIIKLSNDEIGFVMGDMKEEEAVNKLLQTAKMVIITRGKDGASVYYGNHRLDGVSYPTEVCDTTGAGDSFLGSFLSIMSQNVNFEELEKEEEKIRSALKYALVYAGVVCSQRGALPMPKKDKILAKCSKL